ncbi:DUF402 domain-containing protein [Evansella sp. AB-rgal1]|uniref:DUF402 domain-containing protein n=1 Tax=Evansella sp. AB-rgal1 TaxID=3242696 RepID=UPI00359F11D9
MINIMALKYPNIPHYEWQGELLQKTEDYVLVHCKPGRQLKHYTKEETFTVNNSSIEYFSLKEWFTAAMEIEYGKVTSYYCNIAKPSKLEGYSLRFVDLDLDFVNRNKVGWQVIDEDEFVTNSSKYGYPVELKESAIKALEELKRKVKAKDFPFDEDFLRNLHGE